MAARLSLQGLPVGRPGIESMHLSVKAWNTNQLTVRQFLITSFFLFLAVPGSLLWCGLSQVAVSRGYSLLQHAGFLTAVPFPMTEHRLYSVWASVGAALRLWSVGSVVVAHGLSCPKACGILLD